MLVASIIRMLAVRALRGRTLAGQAVFDSRVEPLEQMTGGEKQPVISVQVGETAEAGDGDGLFMRDTTLTLSLDLIVASQITYESGAEAIEIAETDAGLEFSLSVMDRQWRTALSDPDNVHAEALRGLVAGIGAIRSTRGMDPQTGQKHAIRMIEAEILAIAEPAPGAALPAPIDAALTLLGQDPGCAKPVSIMRAELAGGAGLFDWKKAQALLFATAAVPAAIGVGTPDDGEEVAVDTIGVRIEGVGGADEDDTGA